MRIRTKLAVALIIPLLALLGLSSVAISAANDKADQAAKRAETIQQQVDLATASLGPSGVVTALSSERSAEALDLIGLTGVLSQGGPSKDETRKNDDFAIGQFKAAIAAKPEAVRAAYQPAIDSLAKVETIRAEIDAYRGEKSTGAGGAISSSSFDKYSEVIDAVFDANSRVALGIDDPDLRAGARTIDALTRYADIETVQFRVVGFSVINSPNGFTADLPNFSSAVALDSEAATIQETVDQISSPAYHQIGQTLFASHDRDAFKRTIDGALEGKPVDTQAFVSPETTKWIGTVQAASRQAAEQLTADAARLTAAAQQEQADAEAQARLLTIVTVVVLGLAVAVTLLASRSITRPLHRLVGDAEDMATTRLPHTVKDILEAPLGEDVALPELAEVDQSGGYEIAEVAGALNTVQASAAELAVEQAVLRRNIADAFVNLGRRNQNLLSRQLESITEMERQEADPAQLEKLFTLDHLATRMRRNAESLLLLAGLEPHRQWSAPVAIVDVLRGALGEVEDYERVIIDRLDAATISGSAAADLTHLIAELLENALNFSPPGRDVEIIGRATPKAYVLAIVDNGIGMDDADMAQANVRLAGTEAFTVAPSRYLGHYVVGRQAGRLGVAVALQKTAGGGITATIELSSVLAGADDAPTADTTVDATDALVPERRRQAAALVSHGEPVADAPAPAAAEATEAPTSLAEALTTAPDTAADVATADEAPVATTASGYKKRVRGANTPNTSVLSARGGNEPAPVADDAASSTRSALSGLQAGMQRGREEHANNNGEEQS